MVSKDFVCSQLCQIKGKTVALVYIFENEDAAGFQHYWVWKSDIISGWLNAIQEIGCLPFILDVRTFIQKAMNRDLPQIDYVINLNCGSCELSVMSLVPAVCSFLGVPCIPCEAAAIVMSENKLISNIIARTYEMNVPKDLDWNNKSGIYRPLNLGSSIGVSVGYASGKQGTYQEFIPGYDITVPIMYNPCYEDIDILPPIIYIPKNLDPNWIYDEKEKIKDDGFLTYPVMQIEDEVRQKILDFAHAFPIKTFGRVDMRLKTTRDILSAEVINDTISASDLFFVEINSMPTIEKEDSFEFAIEAVKENDLHSLHPFIDAYCCVFSSPTVNGILLASAMLSIKATCQTQMGCSHNVG